MKIITFNANGIRSAARNGFFNWLAQQNADIVCLQEIKAQAEQLDDPIFHPKEYNCYYHFAEKKGYSGVGLYSKEEPQSVKEGLGIDFIDQEGRYLQVDFKDFSVISLYLPSGSAGEHRQAIKYKFLDAFEPLLRQIIESKKNVIICGDWNIAHKPIDLKNWRANQKHSGFLPEERAWLDHVLEDLGFIDAFRVLNQEPDQYTWWSHRGRAYEKNVGWRIDYQIVTPGLSNKIHHVNIYKAEKFSDHAPLIIDYDKL